MRTCPICSNPTGMTHDRPYRPRIYCSRPCRDEGSRLRYRGEVDPVAVFRLLEGWQVTANRAEKIEATRQLTAQGKSAAWIADYLRTTERSVTRYRSSIREEKVA